MKNNLLDQLVRQYRTKHNQAPQRILVTPPAALALGLKESLTPNHNGVPVQVQDSFAAVQTGPYLGIIVLENQVRSVDTFG